jgi:gliding motility-associated lipoprotein GldH
MSLLCDKKYVFTLLLSLLLLSACHNDTLYSGVVDISDSWPKDNAVKFSVPVSDTLMPYSFYVNIRHTGKYRYSNLYLFMETHFPNHTYTRDTIEIRMATPQGKWLGKGWGDVKEDHVLLKPGFRFPLKGNYEFLFWQGMRTDTLKAITSVGIEIDKTKQSYQK